MAKTTEYKQYTRNQRRAVLDTDFSQGMMSSNGLITEGYVKTLVNFTFEKEHSAIIPRPSLRPYQLIMPDMSFFLDDEADLSFWLSDDVAIKAVKECVENGKTYYQNIVGALDPNDNSYGKVAVVTSERSDAATLLEMQDSYTYDVRFSESRVDKDDSIADCVYYSANLPEIHHVQLSDDPIRRTEFPVGTFSFGNSFYCFQRPELLGATGNLIHTVFKPQDGKQYYVFEDVTPKEPSVSEAVAYGYNMLLGSNAYSFPDKHTSPIIQFDGILPYDPSTGDLLMTPRKNQPVTFRCYYDVENDRQFDIYWEWRETGASEWTPLQKNDPSVGADTPITFSNDTVLECTFTPPAADMMIRVSAYPYVTLQGSQSNVVSDTVEKAITVGFDFTVENYGTASAVEQKVYDLATATGMESWNGRLAVWGLPADPTILFLSDYNDPSYFPYPNNIVVFDEPIIYAIEFMDSLAVFTTNKLYQVTLAEDGNSWKSTVLQSHLSIDTWDKHLIQTVRNMLYFKSGNYYYMMVPKAQSLTGELTLAPITTPITSFFDNFSVNVETVLREAYDYTGNYELITYYNFLDYEDIHNIYLYTFDDSTALLHFDVIYNVVDRTWKVWVYESSQSLYPYKPSATEPGLLATTSLIDARSYSELEVSHPARIIQLFCWDKLSVKSIYVPDNLVLSYDPDEAATAYETDEISVLPVAVSIDDEEAIFGTEFADYESPTVTGVLLGSGDYYSGFNVEDIINALTDVYEYSSTYFTFRNFQFLDTGYRDDELQAKKRYREIQLQVNNLDQKNLDFGMEYILDGVPRRIYYKYDTYQMIDEFDPEYGIVYIDATPYLETDLSEIDLTNQWTIDQSLFPDISLWKVRIAVSGKGSAPRLKLKSRNDKRFELISINWISRIMHMR